jgi:predicted PurR-regulated permease PerM
MKQDDPTTLGLSSKAFIDAMIILSLIAVLAYLCLRIVTPFLPVMLWGLILAVMIYPLQQSLAKKLGGRQGGASSILVVLGVLLIVGPVAILGASFAEHVREWDTRFENNELSIAQPGPGVAEWPVVGEKVHAIWSQAAADMPKFLEDNREQIEKLTKAGIANAQNVVGMIFLLIGALIVAGIMMAWGESGSKAMLRVIDRVNGPSSGINSQKLVVATIRSVATGVLGVAVIQSLLFGIGFMLAGIPAPGVFAMIVLVIGIIQLPALIVAIPVIAYVWSSGDTSTAVNVFFTIYFLVAGAADNVLKPMLLGRGVEAPMPVILMGALGGMVAGGFIGLFLGAVLLALGYTLFMGWVGDGSGRSVADPDEAGHDSADTPVTN